MIVKGARIIGLYGVFLFLCTTVSPVFADDGAVLDSAKLIGSVPLTKAGVTQNVYRYIDRIVPELKKIPSERIVKLECNYSGLPEREQDILSAYQIAGRVEKYLREHHKLNLDLWIAAHIGKQTRQYPPTLTFSVFSDDVKNLEKLPVVPATSPAE